ncbi:endonuclease/exonuclease/phosphatase family protein [Actinomycetospora rhizophila]|uniref:Endonuclease/exonuclease/phosphatase family protein n=1 Tax=Actinomycetospora rhizophila TaxID=1416876 RepID=A0ABV9ZMB8_9PSEU
MISGRSGEAMWRGGRGSRRARRWRRRCWSRSCGGASAGRRGRSCSPPGPRSPAASARSPRWRPWPRPCVRSRWAPRASPARWSPSRDAAGGPRRAPRPSPCSSPTSGRAAPTRPRSPRSCAPSAPTSSCSPRPGRGSSRGWRSTSPTSTTAPGPRRRRARTAGCPTIPTARGRRCSRCRGSATCASCPSWPAGSTAGSRSPAARSTACGCWPRTPVAPTPGFVERWSDELDALATWRAAAGGPTVIAGDLNTTTEHRALAPLGDARAPGSPPTWPTRWPRWLGFRIDHVLAGGGIAVRATRVLDLPGSDHRAVLAHLG